MNSYWIALIALLALFIGVCIPVLLQVRATLREVQARVRSSGSRIDKILEDSEVVTARLARLTGGLEGGEESIQELMSALGSFSRSVNKTATWMGLGAAVAPAVVSAVQSYRSSRSSVQETENEGAAPIVNGEDWESDRLSSQQLSTEETFHGGAVGEAKNKQQIRERRET